MNAQLEQAVRSSRPERSYGSRSMQAQDTTSQVGKVEIGVNLAQLISEDGTELTKFKFVPSGKSNQMHVNPNFFFTISNVSLEFLFIC